MSDMLPNLPSELDVVVLRPSNQVEDDPRFQRQFQSDFRVRKKRIVITWLQFTNYNGGFGGWPPNKLN